MARPNMRQGGDGSAPVPFPYARELSHAGIKRAEFLARAERAPLKRVSIKHLEATQESVDPEEVKLFTKHPPDVPKGKRSKSGLVIDHPTVVRRDGRMLIHDGHHRLAAAKLRGDQDAVVRLIDLDGDSDSDSDSGKSSLRAWAGR